MRLSASTVMPIARKRNTDQYLVSIAADAAAPHRIAQPALRVSSERMSAHIASAQSGIRIEFWSNFKPRKL